MRFRTEQPPYSLLGRGIERSVLPVCQTYRMGVLTWSPLAWGFLSGKFRKDRPVDLTTGRAALAPERFDPALPANAGNLEAVEALVELAEGLGYSRPQLAVAFPLTHPAVTSVVIGPRTMEQLQSLLAGATTTLDESTLDRIDEIVPPGTNAYELEGIWSPPELTSSALRRHPRESAPPADRRSQQPAMRARSEGTCQQLPPPRRPAGSVGSEPTGRHVPLARWLGRRLRRCRARRSRPAPAGSAELSPVGHRCYPGAVRGRCTRRTRSSASAAAAWWSAPARRGVDLVAEPRVAVRPGEHGVVHLWKDDRVDGEDHVASGREKVQCALGRRPAGRCRGRR